MTGRVLLLATKDTIAHSRRPGHEAVATGAELLESVPAALRTADVTVEDPLTEPSWGSPHSSHTPTTSTSWVSTSRTSGAGSRC